MKKITNIKLGYAILLLIMSNILFAQSGDTIEIQRNTNGKIYFARFNANTSKLFLNANSFLKTNLNASVSDDFLLLNQKEDELGYIHQIYQQVYNGVPIEGAVYALHGKSGNIETMNGNYAIVNISSTTPNVTEAQAITYALTSINATMYTWQNEQMEQFIKQDKNDNLASYYPKGKLTIAKDASNAYKLAWRFEISMLQPYDEKLIFVDAINGNILSSTSLIDQTNIPATAATQYSGVRAITADQFAGGIRLRDLRNAVDLQTLNLQNTDNLLTAVDFTNSNINFDAANWTSFNQNRPSLDAHWGAEQVIDFWRIVFSRNSIDDAGLRVRNYLNSNSFSSPNASWSRTDRVMRYSNLTNANYNILTSIDIMAHEFGHGINQFTSNLGSQTRDQEEDALNEGLSDIWGACVKQWVDPNKNTWLIGDEVMANPTVHNCSRNLQNPKDSKALYAYPDTYKKVNWNSAGEPHYNSGVLSHWFYLVSQGSGGNLTNDLGNNYNFNGIGITDARSIVYRAENFRYIIAGATYATTRNATIQASRELFGIGSCQEIAVTKAWYAVGVGSDWQDATLTPDINAYCGNSLTLFFNNVPSGITPTWTITPAAGIVKYLSNTGNSITLIPIGNGTINVVGNLGTYCNLNISSFTKVIKIGVPNTPTFSTSTSITRSNNNGIISTNAIVHLISPASNTNYTWKVDGLLYKSSQGPSLMFPIWQCVNGLLYHDFTVTVKAQNACGTSPEVCEVFRQYCDPSPILKPYASCSNIPCIPTKRNPFPCPLAPIDIPKQNINRFKLFQDPEEITSIVVATKQFSADEFSKLFFDADALQNEQVQTIVVLNADGESVLKVSDIAQKVTSIDMSSLPEGNYNIQVYGNGEYSEQQTFNYSLGKSDAQLAEDVATNNVDMTATDAADRIEVMKQQLYKELRTNEELLANSDLLQQFFASQKIDDLGKINDINEALAHYDITTAEGLMLGWQPTTRQSLNCLQYYSYFISYLGGYTFSQQDIDALYVLANSCPDVDGEIVFAARSLYNYVTQLDQDFSTACNGISARSTKKVKALSKVVVLKLVIYPNPSKGNFSIMFPSGYKGVNSVKVLDQTGKILLQKTVISGVQNFSLNQGLSNGVYIVQITNSITGKTENQKLIVNK